MALPFYMPSQVAKAIPSRCLAKLTPCKAWGRLFGDGAPKMGGGGESDRLYFVYG